MDTLLTRRTFLGRGAAGLGASALASMLQAESASGMAPETARWRGILGKPHVAPKARRVIYLYQAGGPSHLETFDYKPRLEAMHGQGMPDSFTKGQQMAQLQGAKLMCFGPQWPFQTLWPARASK